MKYFVFDCVHRLIRLPSCLPMSVRDQAAFVRVVKLCGCTRLFLTNPLEVGELDMSVCGCQIFVFVFASLSMYLTVSPCRCTGVSLDENMA